VSVVLCGLCVVVAAGVYLPASRTRLVLGLAVALSLVLWVIAQGLGEILAGGATDPNSGPLLILLALAYWPARRRAAAPVSRPAVATAVAG
jgi:hypothetical protein